MSLKLLLQKTSGADYGTITVPPLGSGIFNLPSLRVYNDGTDTPTKIRLTVAALKTVSGITSWVWTGATNRQGQECVTEKWVEVKEGAGAWTPIGGTYVTAGNYLEISNPAPGNYTEILLRINIPVGASTLGRFSFVFVGGYR